MMQIQEDTPEVWRCSQSDCRGHRVTSGPISGQRMDEECLVCTECQDETLVSSDRLED